VDSGAHRRPPTGGDVGRGGAALSCARADARLEECVGRRAGLKAHARQVARSVGPRRVGRDAWPPRRRAHGAAQSTAARACGCAGASHGPGHMDRRVVHAVTAYGRRAMWARRGAPVRCRRRDVARGARSGVPVHFQFTVPLIDRSELENFELKFKIAKYESCRPDNPLQLS
jgi:hypothetical protein